MKEFFPTLWENGDLRRRVGESILRGNFSHAYLLQGPKGTGKQHFAHAIAAALCCHELSQDGVPLPCGRCPACHKILNDATPDLRVLGREDTASIGIEPVRRLKEDMYLSPVENEKKIYIINEADRMTTAAQNALLIMLEEPPPNVVILLLCENLSAMLPTVRSRVQVLRMALFSQERLMEFAADKSPAANRMEKSDPVRFADLIAAANGSPGRVLSLFSTREGAGILKLREEIMAVISALGPRIPFSKLYTTVAALPQKRQDLTESLELLTLALRDLILLKREETAPLCFFGLREDAQKRCEGMSLRCLFAASDAVEEAKYSLTHNANVNVVLTTLTDALHRAHKR